MSTIFNNCERAYSDGEVPIDIEVKIRNLGPHAAVDGVCPNFVGSWGLNGRCGLCKRGRVERSCTRSDQEDYLLFGEKPDLIEARKKVGATDAWINMVLEGKKRRKLSRCRYANQNSDKNRRVL